LFDATLPDNPREYLHEDAMNLISPETREPAGHFANDIVGVSLLVCKQLQLESHNPSSSKHRHKNPVFKVEKEVPGRPNPTSPTCPSPLSSLLHCRIQTPQLGATLPYLPFPPLFFPSPSSFLTLEVEPLNTARGSGRALKATPAGSGAF